jgi:hypothetical protein
LPAAKGYSFSVALDPAPAHPMFLGGKHIVTSPINGTTRIAGTMLSGNNRRPARLDPIRSDRFAKLRSPDAQARSHHTGIGERSGSTHRVRVSSLQRSPAL